MTDTTFLELGLSEPLTRVLDKEDYRRPTPIQAMAIPHLLAGKDLLGIAQTGTGKTAAFGLPILQQLAEARQPRTPKSPRALIIAPTRELVIQIRDALRVYGNGLPLKLTAVFGGVGQKPQVDAMRGGVDILVATPGRLLDLMNQGHLKLDGVTHFVLDEADRMLDMGFIRDIKKIVAALPRRRQTMFFSATMPQTVAGLAGDILHEPVRVAATPVATTADRIEQSVCYVPTKDKGALLAELLGDPAFDRTIVFTRTKHRANRVAEQLTRIGINAEAIHGNKSQGARQRALGAFRQGRCRVLVATDIAARGIDVDGISHVVNYELPNVPEDYVHRIGRTARAGASGAAVSLCAPDEQAYLRDIEKLIRRSIEVARGAPAQHEPAPETKKRSGRPPRFGKGGSGRGPGGGRPGGSNSGGGRPNGENPNGGRPSGGHPGGGHSGKPGGSGKPRRSRNRGGSQGGPRRAA